MYDVMGPSSTYIPWHDEDVPYSVVRDFNSELGVSKSGVSNCGVSKCGVPKSGVQKCSVPKCGVPKCGVPENEKQSTTWEGEQFVPRVPTRPSSTSPTKKLSHCGCGLGSHWSKDPSTVALLIIFFILMVLCATLVAVTYAKFSIVHIMLEQKASGGN